MTKLIVAYRTCCVEKRRKWSSRPAVSSTSHATRVDGGISLRPGVTTDGLLVLKSLICTWRPASSVLFSYHVTFQTPARNGNKTITWSHRPNFVGGNGGANPPSNIFSPYKYFILSPELERGKYKMRCFSLITNRVKISVAVICVFFRSVADLLFGLM